ncbi:MAG TPA: alpha/beta hydrolase-fold protein [Mucilaginibacter sp.]|jgi:enterochelin esterase family protein
MKKYLFLSMILGIATNVIQAQQSLSRSAAITSPEIHTDNKVTFRFSAPDAKKVKITGDWMPLKGGVRVSDSLTKGDNGLWSYTTPVLLSDLYSYSFVVDGMRCNDPNNAFVIRDVASIANIFIIGGGKGDYYKVNEVPHGTVSHRWYNAPGAGLVRRLTVYTPPGYESSNAKYPVLYLLHGIGGDEDAWMGLGKASEILDNLIAQKLAVPMIVIMPNGNIVQEAAPGEGSAGYVKPTFMLPNTMDGKFEESFIDIIKFTESNYRVKATKENRAIAGLSMGGYHTDYISRYYPGTFDYMGLFSPALNNKPEQYPSAKAYQNLDKNLKEQMDNGYKLYWIAIGKDDFPVLFNAVKEYRTKLDTSGMKYEYEETEGGHTWTNWRTYLTQFTQRLFK